MNSNCVCIFCGGKSETKRVTGIGEVYVHDDCLELLTELLETEGREREVEYQTEGD